jgi:hypothetical protein
MSKYSFLVASKEIQYFDLTPTVRMKKLGGWLVAESIEQEEISKLQSQSTIRAVQLAKRIAAAKGVSLDEAFALLQGGGVGSEMDLLSDFTEETLSMIGSGGSVEGNNARLVTAFIRCRGEGLIDDVWTAMPDWSMEDTTGFTREVISKALDFIGSEQEVEAKAAAKKTPKKTTAATPNE